MNTTRKFGWIVVIAALGAASGCGGGGTSSFATVGTSSSSSGTTATVAAISMITSEPQIPSNGSSNATLTAYVRDANNQFLSGIPVTFSATSGGLAVTTAVTDASGQATATLNTAGDPTNRNITVTAVAGSKSTTVAVGVVGTAVSLSGPPSLIEGNAGTYTVSVVDSGKAPITGQTVTLKSTAGNTVTAVSAVTNVTGQATFSVTGTVAGSDTLTATALGQTATTAVLVSNTSFAFTAPAANALIALTVDQTVTVVWTTGGVPQTGKVITFSTTRGTFVGATTTTTATTDGTGTATVTISATSAGPAIITASAPGVSAQQSVNFVSVNPSAINLQASPATVPTLGQSTITATVRDSANNLVEGQTVSFELTDVTGGSLSVGSAVTDVQGQAQTVYTASSSNSATNGVEIIASIPAVPAVPSEPVFLTVGGQTVILSLGTGEQLSENDTKTQFLLPYVVQAVDSAGNAINGVNITLDIKSLHYKEGAWVIFGADWVQAIGPYSPIPPATVPSPPTECYNEDVAGNGILAPPNVDVNGNGILDPGSVAAVSPGTVTTAATQITIGSTTTTVNGSAALVVSYPEDHAQWVQVQLTATATVSGTESTTSSTFWLPILATYVTTTTSSPPGEISPYGYVPEAGYVAPFNPQPVSGAKYSCSVVN